MIVRNTASWPNERLYASAISTVCRTSAAPGLARTITSFVLSRMMLIGVEY